MDQAQWVPDERAHSCFQCQARFGFFLRRHHCRACGGVFCGSCTERKLVLKPNTESVRVCDKCYEKETVRQAPAVVDHLSKKDRVLYETRSVCLACSYRSDKGYKFGKNVSYVVQFKGSIYLYAQCGMHHPVLTLICSDHQFYRRMTLFTWNSNLSPTYTDQLLGIQNPNVRTQSSSTTKKDVDSDGKDLSNVPRDPYGIPGVYYSSSTQPNSPHTSNASDPSSTPGSYASTSSSMKSMSSSSGNTLASQTAQTTNQNSGSRSGSVSSAATASASSANSSNVDTTQFYLDSQQIFRRILYPALYARGTRMNIGAGTGAGTISRTEFGTGNTSEISPAPTTPDACLTNPSTIADKLPPIVTLYISDDSGLLPASEIASQIHVFLDLYPASVQFILNVAVGAVANTLIPAVNETILSIHESVNLSSTESLGLVSATASASSATVSSATASSTMASTSSGTSSTATQASGITNAGSTITSVSSACYVRRAVIMVEATSERINTLASTSDSCFSNLNIYPCISNFVTPGQEADVATAVGKTLSSLRRFRNITSWVKFSIEDNIHHGPLRLLTDLVLQNRDIVPVCVFARERSIETILSASRNSIEAILSSRTSPTPDPMRPSLRGTESEIIEDVQSLINRLATAKLPATNRPGSEISSSSTVSLPSVDPMPLLSSLHYATGGLLSPSLFTPLAAFSRSLRPMLYLGGFGNLPLNPEPFSVFTTCVVHSEAFGSGSTPSQTQGQATAGLQSDSNAATGRPVAQQTVSGPSNTMSSGSTVRVGSSGVGAVPLPPVGFVSLQTKSSNQTPLGPATCQSRQAVNLANLVDQKILYEECVALLDILNRPSMYTLTTIQLILGILDKAIAKCPAFSSIKSSAASAVGGQRFAQGSTQAAPQSNPRAGSSGSSGRGPSQHANTTAASGPGSTVTALSLSEACAATSSVTAGGITSISGIKLAICAMLAFDVVARKLRSSDTSSSQNKTSKPSMVQMFVVVNEMDIGSVDILRRTRPVSLSLNPDSSSPIELVSTGLGVL